jgi:hypothetical protein
MNLPIWGWEDINSYPSMTRSKSSSNPLRYIQGLAINLLAEVPAKVAVHSCLLKAVHECFTYGFFQNKKCDSGNSADEDDRSCGRFTKMDAVVTIATQTLQTRISDEGWNCELCSSAFDIVSVGCIQRTFKNIQRLNEKLWIDFTPDPDVKLDKDITAIVVDHCKSWLRAGIDTAGWTVYRPRHWRRRILDG